MPETVGLVILGAVGGTEIGTGIAGLGTLAGTTFAGTSVATLVGGASIIALSIGLQYALSNPNIPTPESGSQPLKQAIPPRIRGYWDNRLAGYYMLFENGNRDSQDVMAFHHGKVSSIQHIYLHDQEVAVVPDVSLGGIGTVQTVGSDQFAGGKVQVEFLMGDDSQTAAALLTGDANINGIWTGDYRGDGIAYGVLKCAAIADPETFSREYPQGLPLMSVVARCSPIWDPRDPDQDENDELTWAASPNPVLQLIDYLTRVDGGMGLVRTDILPDDVLALWMDEADLCDEDLGGGNIRYRSAGWYQFDNKPEDIVNKILASCDGWMSETGDGTLSLTVGVYREPTDPPITDAHILGFSVSYGQADETTINQIEISYTDPSQKYVTTQIDPVRDEDDISLTGVVRSTSLPLTWVQYSDQASRLGQRALLRLNPAMSGTLVTTLYGLRFLGKRWVKVQYPFVAGLEDCVVEIQDRAEFDLLSGTVKFNWSLVQSNVLSGEFFREDGSQYLREDGSVYMRESV